MGSRQTQEQNKPSTLGWNKESPYIKQTQKAFIFQKGMGKKRRERDPLVRFNGRSQDWEQGGPDSDSAATPRPFQLALLLLSWSLLSPKQLVPNLSKHKREQLRPTTRPAVL